MLDKLRAELKEAQAKLARREQLRVMLTDAAAQLNEISARERTLYEQLQKENADVDVMERTTVTSVFYTLLGKKEEKLEKEQREAQAAKLAYQAVTRELADCRDRIDAMTRERDVLTEYIERCVALREQIREALRGDPATAERILALERELTENRTQLREIDEAIDAGQEAMEQIGRIESSLSSAENWAPLTSLPKAGSSAPWQSTARWTRRRSARSSFKLRSAASARSWLTSESTARWGSSTWTAFFVLPTGSLTACWWTGRCFPASMIHRRAFPASRNKCVMP